MRDDAWLTLGSVTPTPAPAARFIRGMAASGTDVAGGWIYLDTGASTGAGAPGGVRIRATTPGASSNQLNLPAETFSIDGFGNVKQTASTAGLGYTLNNGTNDVVKFYGLGAGNVNGQLQLLASGTASVQISSSGQSYINTLRIGNAVSSATPAGGTLSATNGSGTNIAGAPLNVSAGASTGTGVGGSIVLSTSPAGSTGSSTNASVSRVTIDSTGLCTFGNNAAVRVNGNIGFFNTAPAAKPTVSGSRGGNVALASLITALATLGLVTDTTTA